MASDPDLFGHQIETKNMSRAIDKWYMVTNQRNLFYMLAAGLIMPPSGFNDKYYQDTLACFPGWIPVFPGKVPKAAVDYSISEKDHLLPCVLELNISELQGEVKALGQDGQVKDIPFPGGVSGNEVLVLLPAPLPITWITTVFFETKDVKASCEKDASDFNNVDLSDILIKVQKTMFSKTSKVSWPLDLKSITKREVPLERSFAAGGILAMLASIGNTGSLAIEAAKLAFNKRGSENGIECPQTIKAVVDWFDLKKLSSDQSVSEKLFWYLVNSLVDAREQGANLTPDDVVLNALVESSKALNTETNASYEKLKDDLKGISGFGKYSTSELLERHNKALPRSLIMFFLSGNSSDFLDIRQSLLNEGDRVLSAILFGARERWLGLPISLRKAPGLKAACCHRMAEISHKMTETLVSLGPVPARPRSLRELLLVQPWTKVQHEAALFLAKKSGWGCIRTRVTLGKGAYRLEVDGIGAHLIFEGEPKAVKTEANYESVLNLLATEKIPMDLVIKVHNML